MPVRRRNDRMDLHAPDGAEIRNLIGRPEDATRLGLAEALLPPGGQTSKVYHRTIYEEIWYIVAGAGRMHLHHQGASEEEVFPVTPGDCVLILPRTGFWVENTGEEPLIWLCAGSPPWPGPDEARPWPPA